MIDNKAEPNLFLQHRTTAAHSPERVEEMDKNVDSCSEAIDEAHATKVWYSLASLGRVSSPFCDLYFVCRCMKMQQDAMSLGFAGVRLKN
jgi:hypothetical protein